MQTAQEGDKATGVRGRKDQGIEAVPKPEVLAGKLKELVHLHNKKTEASDACNDAIKRVAEKSGLLASVVAKIVAASANDKFEDEKKKADQLSLAFEECAE
jgi:alkylhydroperoxidase family enzyme